MGSRRVEKMNKLIMKSVSDVIMNQLNDPRIEGIISVTRVDMSPDMKNADVFLSIMVSDEKKKAVVFSAIEHASSHISSLVAKDVTSRIAPRLKFSIDDKYEKTIETLRLIEQVSEEIKEKETYEQDLGIEDERQ